MPEKLFDEEELEEISDNTEGTVSQPHEGVSENKVPHNLLKTPRGVNPSKRAGFYANEKPEVLGKTLEESSGVPKGAVFPVVETTPETVFVEWGTRPSLPDNDGGVEEEHPQEGGGHGQGESIIGPGISHDYILKGGIAPLDRVADAEVEVFYGYNDSVEHEVVNLREVDFSGRGRVSTISLVSSERWSLLLIVNDNTFTLLARASAPQGTSFPTDPIYTYVKVTIPEESEIISKLPSECVEGMPLVVNCSILFSKDGDDIAVFDKTFAEMQNYELDDIQFRYHGSKSGLIKSIRQEYVPGDFDFNEPSVYLVYFYDIEVDDGELTISQIEFGLNSFDETSFTIQTYRSIVPSSGDQIGDLDLGGSGK